MQNVELFEKQINNLYGRANSLNLELDVVKIHIKYLMPPAIQ